MIRNISFTHSDDRTLTLVAKEYGVDKQKLWEIYEKAIRSNYFHDLCDLAIKEKEN